MVAEEGEGARGIVAVGPGVVAAGVVPGWKSTLPSRDWMVVGASCTGGSAGAGTEVAGGASGGCCAIAAGCGVCIRACRRARRGSKDIVVG